MGWIVLDPAPEIELIDVDIHSSDPPQVLVGGDEANGVVKMEAVGDGSATRASMQGNRVHQYRPQATDDAATGDSATRTSVEHVSLAVSPVPILVEETRKERQAKRASRRQEKRAARGAKEAREEKQANRASRRATRKNPMSRVKTTLPDSAFPATTNPMARTQVPRVTQAEEVLDSDDLY